MLTIVHGGVELPVYNHLDVVSREQFPAISTGNQQTFVRTALLRGDDDRELGERLTYADSCFDVISNFCGTTTVPHEWGFCPDNGTIKYEDRDDAKRLLPEGFLLVAKVDVIQPIPATEHPADYRNSFGQFLQGLDLLRALQPNRAQLAGHYNEMAMRQVMYGVNRNAPKVGPKLWYVDIDPVVAKHASA